MSHSFYIKDVADASLSATLAALPFDDLVVDAQDDAGGWPELAHVYQDNVSVRAIETAMEDGTLQVRIMANSSPDDFALAAAITEQVASVHDRPIEPEDNSEMPLEQWRSEYGGEWQKEQSTAYLQMLVNMYRDPEREGVLRMWGTPRELHVGPRMMDELLEDPQNFSAAFFERFRRLNYLDREDVFLPSLMAARQEETGKQAVFSVLSEGVPTALSSAAAFVVLNHGDADNEADGDGQTIVTFDAFAEIAGDALTWLGDGLALTPAIEGEAWTALLRAARVHNVGLFDRPELLRDPEEGEHGSADGDDGGLGISADHWEIVAHAPIAVFLLTAGADGTVDKKEIDAFRKKLVEGVAAVGQSEIMAAALMKAATSMDQRLMDLGKQSPENMARLIAASRQVVANGAGAEQAERYATGLYAIAEAVASASGGFFGFGSKIGKEERVVLDGLRRLLQIDAG